MLAVISYKTEAEAIAIANDTIYGLHAYVSTADAGRGKRIADQVAAGRVIINNITTEPAAPFGGFKQSGLGREFGVYGIEDYLKPKAMFGHLIL